VSLPQTIRTERDTFRVIVEKGAIALFRLTINAARMIHELAHLDAL